MMALTKVRMRYIGAAAMTAFFANGALAQTAGQAAGDVPAQTMPAEIAPVSDAEVKQFVAANLQVSEVAVKMNTELQAATDAGAANAIQEKAEQEMVAVIQKEGLTPTRYTEIIQMAQADPALLAKLQAEAGG